MHELELALGITFKDKRILKTALTHTSYINETPSATMESNERLEFLGDALLDLIIAEKLYVRLPDYDEGRLTKARAVVVKEETITRVARLIGLGNLLLLGKGEAATGGREKPANIAAALEAVIAAVYLDRGFDTSKTMVESIFASEIEQAVVATEDTDYKSRLQEMVQSKHKMQPEYMLIKTSGPDHAHEFTVQVKISKTVFATGVGRSKKAAETEAAKRALQEIQNSKQL